MTTNESGLLMQGVEGNEFDLEWARWHRQRATSSVGHKEYTATGAASKKLAALDSQRMPI